MLLLLRYQTHCASVVVRERGTDRVEKTVSRKGVHPNCPPQGRKKAVTAVRGCGWAQPRLQEGQQGGRMRQVEAYERTQSKGADDTNEVMV